MHLVFVTGNAGKFQEAARELEGTATLTQDRAGYVEVQADTLEEVARSGLDDVARRLDPPFLLEDAGLFIDALHGFPGVYSAYVHQTIGLDGILRLLAPLSPDERAARFEAVVAYRDADHVDSLFRGEVQGAIAPAPAGDGGFGYDPIFIPAPGDGRTFAAMAPQEKAHLSHRGIAFRAFADHLRAHANAARPHENPS